MARPLLVLAIAALLGPVAVAQTPVFRAATDIVRVGITVTDKRGNLVTDLTRDDFEVREDGKAQDIQLFLRGDETTAAAPQMHVGLLLDTSGSMGEDIGLARSAAIKFLNTLTDAKDMTLVDFDTEVRVARYEQDEFPRMVERIRSRKPGGFTAMYDALGVYLDGASDNVGRTILVIFTDGGDTHSAIGFSDVLTLLRASDVTVYSVGFLEHQPGSVRFEQRQRLTQIADATGGRAIFPTSMKEIEDAYGRIVEQIRAQYTLGYVSTNAARDGRWRKVEIRVKRPDLKDARLQSRTGYFAPYHR
jgi:Ca-activated chloride channel family protein